MATAGSENFFNAHHERGGLDGLIALVFSYDVDGQRASSSGSTAPRATGRSSSATGRGYVGTELLRDVEIPGRYLVVDRWESREAYNDFVAANREEYMRRVDETAFHYDAELRIGTFESVW